MKRWFTLALVVVAIFATTTAHATHIQSRDFGSDDAYKLAKLATAELPDGTVTDKADLMLDVLEYVWTNGCSIPAAVTHWPSAVQGTYIGTEPDARSMQAVELIYAGYDGNSTGDDVVMVVQALDALVPLMAVLGGLAAFLLLAMALERLQERLER